MQQLSWKNFPVKIEKSLCKLFGPKCAPNSVHNSVTIYSAKALSAFLCVKGASPPRRRGHLIRHGFAVPPSPQGEGLGWCALRSPAQRLPLIRCEGRSWCAGRMGDYQIAPKPPGGRLWVVAVPPPEKAFIHGVSW